MGHHRSYPAKPLLAATLLALVAQVLAAQVLVAQVLVARSSTTPPLLQEQQMTTTVQANAAPRETAPHPYAGMWVTADGHIRHELLPNGRYDEARGNRKSAYRGRYSITGDHIDYIDDTGFIADGDFVDGVLYHAGMVLRRER
jgi:hypothetical protein